MLITVARLPLVVKRVCFKARY